MSRSGVVCEAGWRMTPAACKVNAHGKTSKRWMPGRLVPQAPINYKDVKTDLPKAMGKIKLNKQKLQYVFS